MHTLEDEEFKNRKTLYYKGQVITYRLKMEDAALFTWKIERVTTPVIKSEKQLCSNDWKTQIGMLAFTGFLPDYSLDESRKTKKEVVFTGSIDEAKTFCELEHIDITPDDLQDIKLLAGRGTYDLEPFMEIKETKVVKWEVVE